MQSERKESSMSGLLQDFEIVISTWKIQAAAQKKHKRHKSIMYPLKTSLTRKIIAKLGFTSDFILQ